MAALRSLADALSLVSLTDDANKAFFRQRPVVVPPANTRVGVADLQGLRSGFDVHVGEKIIADAGLPPTSLADSSRRELLSTGVEALLKLNANDLRARGHCKCLLGLMDVGKTHMVKVLAFLAAALPNVIPVYVDAKNRTTLPSDAIVTALVERGLVTAETGAKFRNDIARLLLVLAKSATRVFLVVDAVHGFYRREGGEDAIGQLRDIGDQQAENTVLAYITGSNAKLRGMVAGSMPIDSAEWPSYDGVGLNVTKFRLVTCLPPLMSAHDFRLLLAKAGDTSPASSAGAAATAGAGAAATAGAGYGHGGKDDTAARGAEYDLLQRQYLRFCGHVSIIFGGYVAKPLELSYASLRSELAQSKRLHDALWEVVNEGGKLERKIASDVFSVTRSDLTAAATLVCDKYDGEVKDDDFKRLLYDTTDSGELCYDDSAMTVGFPHVGSVAVAAAWGRYKRWVATDPRTRSQLTEDELSSLLDPGGKGVCGRAQNRELNESLVALSLAGCSPPAAGLCDGLGTSAEWLVRSANNGGGSDKAEVSLFDSSAWTGELFKEVPNKGANLVRVVPTAWAPVDGGGTAKVTAVTVDRIQVNLAGKDAEGFKNSGGKDVNAGKIIEALKLWEAAIIAQFAETAVTATVTRHLVTVRELRPGHVAAKAFEDAGVSVLDRDTMRDIWLPSIKASAAVLQSLPTINPRRGLLDHYA